MGLFTPLWHTYKCTKRIQLEPKSLSIELIAIWLQQLHSFICLIRYIAKRTDLASIVIWEDKYFGIKTVGIKYLNKTFSSF